MAALDRQYTHTCDTCDRSSVNKPTVKLHSLVRCQSFVIEVQQSNTQILWNTGHRRTARAKEVMQSIFSLHHLRTDNYGRFEQVLKTRLSLLRS
jgi:hypothetical protein